MAFYLQRENNSNEYIYVDKDYMIRKITDSATLSESTKIINKDSYQKSAQTLAKLGYYETFFTLDELQDRMISLLDALKLPEEYKLSIMSLDKNTFLCIFFILYEHLITEKELIGFFTVDSALGRTELLLQMLNKSYEHKEPSDVVGTFISLLSEAIKNQNSVDSSVYDVSNEILNYDYYDENENNRFFHIDNLKKDVFESLTHPGNKKYASGIGNYFKNAFKYLGLPAFDPAEYDNFEYDNADYGWWFDKEYVASRKLLSDMTPEDISKQLSIEKNFIYFNLETLGISNTNKNNMFEYINSIIDQLIEKDYANDDYYGPEAAKKQPSIRSYYYNIAFQYVTDNLNDDQLIKFYIRCFIDQLLQNVYYYNVGKLVTDDSTNNKYAKLHRTSTTRIYEVQLLAGVQAMLQNIYKDTIAKTYPSYTSMIQNKIWENIRDYLVKVQQKRVIFNSIRSSDNYVFMKNTEEYDEYPPLTTFLQQKTDTKFKVKNWNELKKELINGDLLTATYANYTNDSNSSKFTNFYNIIATNILDSIVSLDLNRHILTYGNTIYGNNDNDKTFEYEQDVLGMTFISPKDFLNSSTYRLFGINDDNIRYFLSTPLHIFLNKHGIYELSNVRNISILNAESINNFINIYLKNTKAVTVQKFDKSNQQKFVDEIITAMDKDIDIAKKNISHHNDNLKDIITNSILLELFLAYKNYLIDSDIDTFTLQVSKDFYNTVYCLWYTIKETYFLIPDLIEKIKNDNTLTLFRGQKMSISEIFNSKDQKKKNEWW